MKDLKWNRLKNIKCPKCNGDLMKVMNFGFGCLCGFNINQKRFDEIVTELYNNPRKKFAESGWDENMAELNNLGHDTVAEDFSDSPHLN